MTTATKAKELLSEIDRQIADAQRSLKVLQSERKGVARLVSLLSGGRSVGRPRGAGVGAKRTRTNWDKVIASFKGAFSIDDLAKASKKAKGTVNQAIQNLKKAGKIKPTGKRGEYQRAGAVTKAAKPKAPTKKKAVKPKAKSAPKKKAASAKSSHPVQETKTSSGQAS